jgi:hypothetical protein
VIAKEAAARTSGAYATDPEDAFLARSLNAKTDRARTIASSGALAAQGSASRSCFGEPSEK